MHRDVLRRLHRLRKLRTGDDSRSASLDAFPRPDGANSRRGKEPTAPTGLKIARGEDDGQRAITPGAAGPVRPARIAEANIPRRPQMVATVPVRLALVSCHDSTRAAWYKKSDQALFRSLMKRRLRCMRGWRRNGRT